MASRPSTAAVRLLTGEREPVRVATTANITLSGLQTIDGVTVAVADRVLVKNQTDASENGIYTVSAGAWFRASDARFTRAIQKGTTVHVTEGTTHASQVFAFQTLDPVVGTDDIAIGFFFSDDTGGAIDALRDSALNEINSISGSALSALEAVQAIAEGFASDIVSQGNVPIYGTKTGMTGLSVPSGINAFRVNGYTAAGDRGGALYTKAVSEPSHDGKVQSADGAWWELAETVVNVRHFGAKGDGVADDTTAFASAFAFIKLLLSMASSAGSAGSGYPVLYVPAGFYRITDQLTVSGFTGLTVQGDGSQSSVLCLDATSKILIKLETYINCRFEKLGFTAGSIAFNSGKPYAVLETAGSRTNVCIGHYTAAGGTDLVFDTCRFVGFAEVENSTYAALNGDMVHHPNCIFRNNDIVWENSNTQAVAWTYTDCKFFFNEKVFYNAGASLIVRGGDSINPGDFYTCTGVTSLGGEALIQGVRFETYQNIDNTKTPRWIVLSGTLTGHVLFEDCSARGGGTLGSKTCGTFSGVFNVEFRRCYFDGNFAVAADTSTGNRMSRLRFDRCHVKPTITQTLSAGQGNRPITVEVVEPYGAIRNQQGLVASGSYNPGGPHLSGAGWRFSPTVNANSFGADLNFLPEDPYSWTLAGGRFIFKSGTSNSVTFTLWADDTKTTKIWELTRNGVAGANVAVRFNPADLTNHLTLAYNSDPPYFEITSAANMGVVNVNLDLDYMMAA